MKTKFGYLSQSDVSDLGFASVGDNVLIHELANIVGHHLITLGSNIRIDGYTNLIASAFVNIGNHVHIGSFCHISASHPVILEDCSGLSQGVYLYTASDDYSGGTLTNPTHPREITCRSEGPIRVGAHAILGAKAVVLPGVTIGEGAAVGALSLIKADLEAWHIHGGIPARRIGPRSRALLDAAGAERGR